MSIGVLSKPRVLVFIGLLALLAVTRVGHFGSAVNLPDASLAVFFMGGLWLGGLRCFAAYAAVAFGIDVLLAQGATEAGWCLTPAYGGLVAAYGVVWLFGRGAARAPDLPILRYAGLGVAAVLAHFLISNLSFWAFSGYFGSVGALDYGNTVLKYLPPYLSSTALYLTLGWLLRRLLFKPRAAAHA